MKIKDTAEKINTILLCEEEFHRSPRGTHQAHGLFGFLFAVFSFLPISSSFAPKKGAKSLVSEHWMQHGIASTY